MWVPHISKQILKTFIISYHSHEIADTHSENEPSLRGGWPPPEREGEEFGSPGGAQSRTATPPH